MYCMNNRCVLCYLMLHVLVVPRPWCRNLSHMPQRNAERLKMLHDQSALLHTPISGCSTTFAASRAVSSTNIRNVKEVREL